MLEMVVVALQASEYVDRVVVVGLEEEAVGELHFTQPVSSCPDQGSIVANVSHGLRWLCNHHAQEGPVLICTADIPLLTAEAVSLFVESCLPFDRLIYYSVVSRAVLERRFPASQRTFVRLRDGDVSGGNLFLIQPHILQTDERLWQRLSEARKHPWRLARRVGLWTLLRFLLRRVTLAEAEQRASRLLGSPVRAVLCAHPELAMDVDKPNQLELVKHHV